MERSFQNRTKLGNTSIIHKYIKTSPNGDQSVYRILNLIWVRDVACEPQSHFRIQLFHGPVKVFRINVKQSNTTIFGKEFSDRRQTNSSGGTSNQHDLWKGIHHSYP